MSRNPSDPHEDESAHARAFYDELAEHYHRIFADWGASIERQGEILQQVIHEAFGETARDVLDAAAGIGTQTLGLATRGFHVTASDVAPRAIARCRREARTRDVSVPCAASDLRALPYRDAPFDVVLACDNALPHLLSDDEILLALRETLRCTRPGGGVILTLRDYRDHPTEGIEFHPYGARRDEDGVLHLMFQVWEWDGEHYDFALHHVCDHGGDAATSRIHRARYYALTPAHMMSLMRTAGYVDVRSWEGVFYQPLLTGSKPD
ncbi:MAG: class I SAM-dependent methyltransferase [Planctomycetes bacterium]|nr:class I SAM-dependent methyltransferase [Planctomycetota bacterium]MCB9890843.1 class I SAM-dependent methyltransferase [Planctomycetota bacterium]